MTTTQLDGDFDPLGPAFVADPYRTWEELQQRCPVARGGRWGFWALTRYEDIKLVSRRPATFTSAQGITVPRNPVSGRRAPLHFDPPEHPQYRRPLNAPLSAERVEKLRGAITDLAGRLVTQLVTDGEADVVAGLTSPLTGIVFGMLIGLDEDRARELNAHSERFEAGQLDDAAVAEEENLYLYRFLGELVAQRRRAPLDPETDIVTALLRARVDGQPMDDAFIAGSLRQLLIAAHVAPTAALASAIGHLAQDRVLQDRLRAEPALVPDAVTELLRLYTPNQGFSRTATCDTLVRGQPIAEGEQVALVLTAANRDPEVFERPDECVLGRDPNPHIAFGHGSHKCAGIDVALTEMRIALTELLARTERFELAGAITPLRWPLAGPAVLPLRCVAAG